MRSLDIKRILAATDLSKPALVGLRYARLFAERFAAGLTVMYADPLPLSGDVPERFAQLEKEIRAYAGDALEGFAFDVAGVGGQPVPTIVHEAHVRAADLLVLATHGLRGWRRAILGSVTEGVLHAGQFPVLSVSRPDERPMASMNVTRILCPINFTEVARDALDYAAFLADAFGCELTVVHIGEQDEPLHAAEDLRSWIGPSIRNRCEVREFVLRGGAAERALDCAEDIGADLLVVGAQQRMFRDATTIGTTTERLVRFARLPVLTVPRLPVTSQEG